MADLLGVSWLLTQKKKKKPHEQSVSKKWNIIESFNIITYNVYDYSYYKYINSWVLLYFETDLISMAICVFQPNYNT